MSGVVAVSVLGACFGGGGGGTPAASPPLVAAPAAEPPTPAVPREEPQGWACFVDATQSSQCEFTEAKCRRKQAGSPDALPCERAASVWCFDTDATDAEPAHRQCVKFADECSARKPGASACAEETETPMQRFERLEQARQQLETRLIESGRASYSCFDWFSKAANTRIEVCEVTADCTAKQQQLVAAGVATAAGACVAMPSVWCFADADTTCLSTQVACDERRATVLAGRLSDDNACFER